MKKRRTCGPRIPSTDLVKLPDHPNWEDLLRKSGAPSSESGLDQEAAEWQVVREWAKAYSCQ